MRELDDADLYARLLVCGYREMRVAPSGEIVGLMSFLFTTGLVVGISDSGDYRTRFCYAKPLDAFNALRAWDGVGDPPGVWIKEKGVGVDRRNPTLAETFRGIPIVAEK